MDESYRDWYRHKWLWILFQMKEKFDKTVTLKGITVDTLNTLLDFLYTQKIAVDEENVSDLLYAASIM